MQTPCGSPGCQEKAKECPHNPGLTMATGSREFQPEFTGRMAKREKGTACTRGPRSMGTCVTTTINRQVFQIPLLVDPHATRPNPGPARHLLVWPRDGTMAIFRHSCSVQRLQSSYFPVVEAINRPS